MTLLVLLLILIAGGLGWFFFPAVMDVLELRRQNARITALTKQTKKDMDDLARRQRKDGW